LLTLPTLLHIKPKVCKPPRQKYGLFIYKKIKYKNMKNSEKQNLCKIVATVGSIDGREDLIEKLYLAGASVFRMNLSHAPVSEHAQKVKIIRDLEKKYNTSLGVIFDLQGPKLRVGTFKNGGAMLKDGQTFILDSIPQEGDENRVNLPHEEIFAAIKKDKILLFNDGLIRVRVEKASNEEIITTVLNGGFLSNHKGVNVPDVVLPLSALTEQDIRNIKEAENIDADWFALSFVQKPEDILLARGLIKSKTGIIAKIEKPSAVENIDKITELSDVIMVARGDLGVEVSPEKVPVIQKKIISLCRSAGKPVIVATQMLESMINNINPTRAEASDVATAVFEGTDAVMLSGETANGKYPIESVETMARIVRTVEEEPLFENNMYRSQEYPKDNVAYALTAAASVTANLISTANVIVNFTDSGKTTLDTAKQRPCLPILSLTPYVDVARKMSVVWGVRSKVVNELHSFEDIPATAKKAVKELNLGAEGDQVVITAGIPFGSAGDTNLMYVTTL
jgi:pyruvate kinase